MNKGGIGCLAAGIVFQALKDYEKAERRLKKNPESEVAKAEIEEIERFFKSGWFQTLREASLEVISENMLEEFKNDGKRISATGFFVKQKDKGKGKTARSA